VSTAAIGGCQRPGETELGAAAAHCIFSGCAALHCLSYDAQADRPPTLQEKLSQAKEDELQSSLADTAKQLEEARAAAQEQARRLADEERQLARLQHEADMKVALPAPAVL
jgi:hypothetical protein